MKQIKLGMTGARTGITDEAIGSLEKFLHTHNVVEAHHGDCVGADKLFHEIAAKHNIRIIVHPPKNNAMRSYCKGDVIKEEKEYIKRNHDIVDDSDMLVAFPSTKSEILRSGTWATIRYARKQHKLVLIIFPDGSAI